MKKGLLMVISGPSGCGKGTVCKQLIKKHPEIKVSISATTRDQREGEVDGREYFFISKEKFESDIENNGFLEYAKIYSGQYYGTPKKFVMDTLDSGNDLILEIDIQGALQVKEKFEEGVFIFLVPPTMDTLRNRLITRGRESEDLIQERFNAAFKELDYAKHYDYVVVNDQLDQTISDVEAIITSEKLKTNRNTNLINNIINGGK